MPNPLKITCFNTAPSCTLTPREIRVPTCLVWLRQLRPRPLAIAAENYGTQDPALRACSSCASAAGVQELRPIRPANVRLLRVYRSSIRACANAFARNIARGSVPCARASGQESRIATCDTRPATSTLTFTSLHSDAPRLVDCSPIRYQPGPWRGHREQEPR